MGNHRNSCFSSLFVYERHLCINDIQVSFLESISLNHWQNFWLCKTCFSCSRLSNSSVVGVHTLVLRTSFLFQARDRPLSSQHVSVLCAGGTDLLANHRVPTGQVLLVLAQVTQDGVRNQRRHRKDIHRTRVSEGKVVPLKLQTESLSSAPRTTVFVRSKGKKHTFPSTTDPRTKEAKSFDVAWLMSQNKECSLELVSVTCTVLCGWCSRTY